MNRKNNWWIWLLLFFVFGGSFGTALLPFIMMAVVFFAIKSIKASNENPYTSRTATRRRTTVNRYGMSDTRHTAAEKARVNSYLLKRFRSGAESVSLSTAGHAITLILNDKTFQSFDRLGIDCDGHSFDTVAAFRSKYDSIYDQIFDSILTMAANETGLRKDTIVDAEYTRAESKKKETVEKKQEPETTQAEKFREEINSLNQAIPNEEITNGLYETTSLLKQLSDLETSFPDQKGKLDKLYETYLPYMIGILKQYTLMQNVQTDPNYKKNEEGLRKTIGYINAAMRDRLIPAMSESSSINFSADLSTLETMLKKDGMMSEDDIMLQLQKQQNKAGESNDGSK